MNCRGSDTMLNFLPRHLEGSGSRTSSDDGRLGIWDENDGRQIAELRHEGAVRLLAVASDERHVAIEEKLDAEIGIRLWRLNAA